MANVLGSAKHAAAPNGQTTNINNSQDLATACAATNAAKTEQP